MSDDLGARAGLPADLTWLREGFPRSRWSEPGLEPTAAHWLQMHAGFRAHQDHMAGLVANWRGGRLDLPGLHRALIPALQAFLQHLDGHHRIESGHYFPHFRRIEPRIQAGIDLLDRDHDAIHAHLETLFRAGQAFHQGVAGGSTDADPAARLCEALAGTAPQLARHLDDEEDIVIPLLARYGAASA